MSASTGDPAVPASAVALPSGARMPLLGFGTWQLTGSDALRATTTALATGYRHIDTATMYTNETEVGKALRDSGVDRSDVFVTTKLPPDRVDKPSRTLDDSLRQLQTDYVDLWLIHWPPNDDAAVWEAFISARDKGLVRDIGVSNYSLTQIDALSRSGVTPAVNQIKWSPLLYDDAVVAGHRERGVVLEGYSALRGGTLEHPQIVEIADRIGRTPAQVIIRWHLQHETVVIPRSKNAERIAANADVDDFTLSPEDMAALDSLGHNP